MLSRFTLSFLCGLLVSVLFVRSFSHRHSRDERAKTDLGVGAAPIRARGLSRREQRVLLSLFFAGAIAWSLHLMVGYAIVSMGCTSSLDQMTLFGFGAIPMLVGLVTLATALVSASAGVLAYREWQRRTTNHVNGLGDGRFLALGGTVLSGVFTALILLEAVPALAVRACI